MSRDFLEELDTLVPRARVVATLIGDIAVAPLVTAQIPPFLRAARPLLDAIEDSLEQASDLPSAEMPTGSDWLGLMEKHGESLIESVAVATGKSAGEIGKLPPDHTVALIQAVLEENLDFFVRRLLPATAALMTGILGRLGALAGRTSSSDSSPTVTAAPTS